MEHIFQLDKERKVAIESKSGGRGITRSLLSFREKYKPVRTIIASRDILDERDGIIYLPFVFISSLVEPPI